MDIENIKNSEFQIMRATVIAMLAGLVLFVSVIILTIMDIVPPLMGLVFVLITAHLIIKTRKNGSFDLLFLFEYSRRTAQDGSEEMEYILKRIKYLKESKI